MKVKFRCHILRLVLSLLVSVLIQWCNRTSAVCSDNVKTRKRWLRNGSASSSTKLQPPLMSSVSDLYLTLNCAGLCAMQVIFAKSSQPVAALGQWICSHQIDPCLLQLPLLSKLTVEQMLSQFVCVVHSGCCWKCCQDGATSSQKRHTGCLNYRWTETIPEWLSASAEAALVQVVFQVSWLISQRSRGYFLPHNALSSPLSLYFQAGPLPLHRALFMCYMVAVSWYRSVVQHLVLSIVFNVFVFMFVQANGSSWNIVEK